MRIAIFGTGGVGGYFGGRLAQAGADVIFIARGQHLEAMRSQGLSVTSLAGDFVVKPVQVSDNPSEVGPVDVVLVATKAWQVSDAARVMQPMVGPGTLVVPLQNGVEAPAQLAELLGDQSVAGGFCRIVSYIEAPGRIRHAGAQSPYIAFGELDNRSTDRVQRLYQAFAKTSGLTVDLPLDIQAAMWGKFAQICAWSGIGAITRAPAGVWRSIPETRRMWQTAIYEVIAVAQALNIALTKQIVPDLVAYVDNLPAQATASMQRDILDGRPSELESQNGAVVRLGRQVGVSTPTNAFIYHALLPLESKARGLLDFPST